METLIAEDERSGSDDERVLFDDWAAGEEGRERGDGDGRGGVVWLVRPPDEEGFEEEADKGVWPPDEEG